MENTQTIDIATTVAPIVASRDAVATLREKVAKIPSETVQLDMANVDFISRSAAHELLQVKEFFAAQTPKKTVDFINANDTVSAMLRVVASNRAVPLKKPVFTNIENISVADLEKPSLWHFVRRIFAH
jgi:hypothetical protein